MIPLAGFLTIDIDEAVGRVYNTQIRCCTHDFRAKGEVDLKIAV